MTRQPFHQKLLISTILAISLGVSSCAQLDNSHLTNVNPPQNEEQPSSTPDNLPTAQDKPTSEMVLFIKGDDSLRSFSTQQSSGVCLKDLTQLRSTMTLPQALSGDIAKQLSENVDKIEDDTVTVSSRVDDIDELILGYRFPLPQLPLGDIFITTELLSASGIVMGTLKYQLKLTQDSSKVEVILKSVSQETTAEGCPVLTADISGASLLSADGGLVLSINAPKDPTPLPGSEAKEEPKSEPSASLSDELPAPSNLKLVSRSTSSLTVEWDFAPIEEAHSYNLFIDGKAVDKETHGRNYTFSGLSSDEEYTLEVQSVQGTRTSDKISISVNTTSSGSGGSILVEAVAEVEALRLFPPLCQRLPFLLPLSIA